MAAILDEEYTPTQELAAEETRIQKMCDIRGGKMEYLPESLISLYISMYHIFLRDTFQTYKNKLNIYSINKENIQNYYQKLLIYLPELSLQGIRVDSSKFKEITELVDDYDSKLAEKIIENQENGYIFPSYNGLRIKSGRIFDDSVYQFNRLPKKSQIRKWMIPTNDRIVSLDWNSLEWKIACQMAKEVDHKDPHQFIAKQLNVSREEAKKRNYVSLYSGFDKEGVIERIFPRLFKFSEELWKEIQKKGYGQSLFGRIKKLSMEEENEKPKFFNYVVQASAAEVVGFSICHIYDYLREMNVSSKLSLFIYDNLFIDYAEKDGIALLREIINRMKYSDLKLSINVSQSDCYDFTGAKSEIF